MTAINYTPEELASEQWMPIPDFPLYEVSNLGRIKSFQRRRVTILKTPPRSAKKADYLCVELCNGAQVLTSVHMIVASIFLGPPPAGKICNHKDGDKTNPRLSNLEYVTPSENGLHAYANGLCQRGESMPAAKLTEDQVQTIIERLANGERGSLLALEYAVSKQLIWQIGTGKAWKHVPRPTQSLTQSGI